MSVDASRTEIYAAAVGHLEATLAPSLDEIGDMATTCAVLHALLPAASWIGFYRVVSPGMLQIGPYQGPLGCLEIPFERGVCGAAARERRTQVVEDVHAFPGHIACDAAARSEIVVPILARDGRTLAVLDLDSHRTGAFDDEDRLGLEALAELLAARWDPQDA